jgi:hypothetical protein
MKTGTKYQRGSAAASHGSESSERSAQSSGRRGARLAVETYGSSQFVAPTQKKSTRTVSLSAREADRRFDEGESIFDLGMKIEDAGRPGVQRVNLDIPKPLLARIDHDATERGIPRQAFLKNVIFEFLDRQDQIRQMQAELKLLRQELKRVLGMRNDR